MIEANTGPLGVRLVGPDGQPHTVDWTSSKELGLKAGRFSVKRSQDGAWWVRRDVAVNQAFVYMGDPDASGQLVRSFCWERFEAATGLSLLPGEMTRANIEWA